MHKKTTALSFLLITAFLISTIGNAAANPSPNGGGQPGAPNTTCQTFTVTPGNAANAPGSVFNPNGHAGTVYAGNPGTDSAEHSNSIHAVAQYDVACFQQTTHAAQ